MDLKMTAVVFGSVFLAELGDKTQLATFLFASDQETSRWGVFLGASLALIASSAIAVLAGGVLARYIDERVLAYAAGALFIGIGIWTILRA